MSEELGDTVNEAIERSHEADHGGGHGPHGHGGKLTLNAMVAISVAVTATCSALIHLKNEKISETMQHVQAKSVDAWAYYQAKGTKLNIVEATADNLKLERELQPGLGADARALLDKKIAAYADKVRHYETEKEQIKATAEGLEEEYDRLEARDDQFDMAEAIASVSIALFGIAALTQRKRLLYLAAGFAILGIGIGVAGFAGIAVHVGAFSRAMR
jgi:hypothetical protein